MRMTLKPALLAATAVLTLATFGSSPADAVVYGSQIESDRIAAAGWDASAPAVIGGGENPGDVRNDPAYALGPSDGYFFSLGLDGIAVFDFGTEFLDQATVFEITFGCGETSGACSNHPEGVEVYGLGSFTPDPTADGTDDSIDLSGASLLGTVSNADAQGGASVSFLGSSFRFLALKDISASLSGISQDGFDVDAVSVVPVPLPASLVLLLSAFGGLGFLGWRRRTSGDAAA